jgi:hypothetical protein
MFKPNGKGVLKIKIEELMAGNVEEYRNCVVPIVGMPRE